MLLTTFTTVFIGLVNKGRSIKLVSPLILSLVFIISNKGHKVGRSRRQTCNRFKIPKDLKVEKGAKH